MYYCILIINLLIPLLIHSNNGSQSPQTVFYVMPTALAHAHGGNTITTISIPQQSLLQTIKPNALHIYEYLKTYVKEHALFLASMSTFGLYALLICFLLNEHHALKESYYWSSWHKNELFESLYTHSPATLKMQLIKDIATQYVNPNNPMDPLWPLTHFISAIKKEELRLNRYIYIANIIKKTPLVRILPSIQDQSAQEALNRLLLIYRIFTEWSADITWDSFKKNNTQKIQD